MCLHITFIHHAHNTLILTMVPFPRHNIVFALHYRNSSLSVFPYILSKPSSLPSKSTLLPLPPPHLNMHHVCSSPPPSFFFLAHTFHFSASIFPSTIWPPFHPVSSSFLYINVFLHNFPFYIRSFLWLHTRPSPRLHFFPSLLLLYM